MDILISIAGKIAEYSVAPIGRQAGYLLFYKDNFKIIKDQVEELERIKERMEHDVEEEKRNGKEIEADVLSWQNTVSDTIKEAKLLCEDPRHANVGCTRWSFPNLKSRHQLSRNAKKMAENILEVKGKGKFERLGYFHPLDVVNFIATTRGSEKLESRNLVKKDIVLSLGDPKISKIGVYGLSGVGKTTLVKEVAKQVKDNKLFDEVVLATISQTSDTERIQNVIADQLGLRFEEITTVGRANRLCERIKKEKSILIILDDLWEKIDLEKLGIPSVDIQEKINLEMLEIPSKDNYEGCKLLLTSRNKDILQKNETQKNFKLKVLDDLESWNLFEDMIGDAVKDVSLQNIATQMAQRCAGLPVLIATIAKSLKDKDIHYWKDVLNNLNRVDNRDMRETLFSALEFNYNRLEDDEAKKLFLLCGVQGTSVWVSDLLKYVIGLGVLEHINTIEDARNRLYRIIDDLKASSLLLDDDASAGVIKMHDIVCEVAMLLASRDHVFTMRRNDRLQDWPSEDFLKRCSQIILKYCSIRKLPQKLDCPNLKFFHLNSTDNPTLKIPHSFFEGMGNLEVVDLTGMIISSLPSSLASLTKLQTLCLDHCTLKDMAGIGTLKSLEILGFIHSSMKEFPSEIGQLTRLRMLDLGASKIEVIPPKILSKLTKLEELYMGNTSITWEEESSTKQNKNASVAELRHLTSLTTLEIQSEAWILPKDMMFEKLERYKIVIGDKWTWSDSEGTTRLLKLKLDARIHLEHGIKMLINKVEDLYLDEMNGISNILFHLNGEGFPLLKHLHIQNNGEIQHIANYSMRRNLTDVLFPKLETLSLHNLNLVKICHDPLTANFFGKLKVVKVKSCNQLVCLFSILMVKALPQLIEIEVSECSSMKKIVLIENVDSVITIDDKIEVFPLRSLTLQHLPAIDDFCSLRTEVPTSFFHAKVKFSNLETLKLSSINLKKIWDDEHLSAIDSINHLVSLIVEDCRDLKYLLSSSMIPSLVNLKQLEISKCDMMEEIISTKGRNGAASKELITTEVLFLKLETIIIKDMQNLKTIWNPILTSNSMGSFKTLEINKCEKIENIFPAYMNRTFASLETLTVTDCNSLQEIFQLGVNDMGCVEQTSQLKKITLLRLPKLKQIWSRDPQSSLHFHNLQVVRVEECSDLVYLFPFSIAMEMLQLEEITISNAGRMKEIVSQNEGSMDALVNFEFNHLTSIVLWHLSDVEQFFAGNHNLSCPVLKELDVFSCPKLKLFKTLYSNAQENVSDNKLQISMQQPLFTVEEVLCNLEKLALNSEDASMLLQGQVSREQLNKLKILYLTKFEDQQATFPYWFLQNITSLEHLLIEWSSFKEIFRNEIPTDEKGKSEIRKQLKKLTLSHLHQLQDICKEGFQIDPILMFLEYLRVKQCSNLKHLVPSSVTFSQLTYLEVENCSELIDLFTSSTARSLVKLKTLKIRECDSVVQIVIEEGVESKDEIAFKSLEVLELERLPKLKMFCSSNCFLKIPLLEKLVIMQCPRMKTFSTWNTSAPLLRKILTNQQGGKLCCEGDLNTTVNKMFKDMVAFRSFEHLQLSQHPELRDLWYSPVQLDLFGNLKHLVVQKCDFLSDVLLPLNLLQALSNLEKFQVSECDSLEAVFDLTNMNQKLMLAKVTIHLKTITLSSLPKLKHIWKQNSQEIVSFDRLRETSSGSYQGLRISEFQGLGKTSVEGEKSDMQHIHQPASLIEQLLFPNLETIIIKKMPELKTVWHPLFTSKSISSLKTMEVLDSQKLENIFPSYVQRAFASLETLMVSDCNSIQVIFEISSEMSSVGDTIQLRKLNLLRLSKLKQIWSKDPQANLCFHNLQLVCVEDCENLEYLLPFSIALHAIQLEDIIIKQAGSMKQIVPDKEGTMNSPVKFELNHLTTLVLWDLHELEGFFAGNHSLSCSSLRELDVYNCAKLKLFKTRYSDNQGRVSDSKPQISMQQPLFTLEEVLCNLETLVLNNEDANMILQGQFSEEQLGKLKILYLTKFEDEQATFPYWSLQNITSLEHLIVEWSSFKEIFQNEMPIDEKGNFEIKMRLKKLTLGNLHQLQHICKEGFQIDPILVVLEYLKVNQCSNLKHLVPSSVTFSHLSHLEVQNCNGLIDLMTSSTARSLVKLTTMKVRDCNSLEHVVAEGREEAEDEIAFDGLEILELERLPMIKRFCSSNCVLNFPLLDNVVVKQCPRMKIFSVRNTRTPKLQKILSKEEDEKQYWEGDLNRTMNKMFVDMVAFCSFKHLELSHYPELRELWYSQVQQDVFGNLKSLVVQKCDFLSDVLLPLNLLQALSNLEELQVRECGSLEAVFNFSNMNEKEMLGKETIHLKTITLSSLPKLKHIWKQHSQEIVNFDNLGQTSSSNNSQGLIISNIQGFGKAQEEEDEADVHRHQQPASLFEQVLFPNLEYLKRMEVSDCVKLEKIFPSYMQRAFASLETLMVSDCNSIQVIFEISSKMSSVRDTTQLRKLTLLRLSKLKQIWSSDPQANLCFHNLQHVRVEDCKNMECLLPFSIAMHAIQLEDITIKQAGRMKQIVADTEGTTDSPVKFELHRLTTLVLWDLHELEGFFAGNHSLSCPSLRELDVYNCAKLKLFKTRYSDNQGRVSDSEPQISMQQPLFTLEEVLCNLETLVLNNEDANMILQGQFSEEQLGKLKILYLTKFEDEQATFPYWSLQNITSLEHLIVEWSSFKEIFQNEMPIDEKGNFEIKMRLKKLTLGNLHQLQHICKEGFQIDPILVVLEYLKVNQCSNLKHLVPSSVTFSHLSHLEVQNCNGLIDLMTSSTARSLVKLTTMKVRDCNSLEHVVAEGREEAEDEIAFDSLEILELERLPMIKRFCSSNCVLNFPLLENVAVKQCPRMKIFSVRNTRTPKLQKILSKEEDEKQYWEGDLNRTMNKMFVDMVAFRSFKHLELSQYPVLRELWYSHVQQDVFGNLKSLVVQKCDFLSDVLLPLNLLEALSKLEDLQVRECGSLEAVFDLTNMNEKKMLGKETIRLKKITLSNLPGLKHIWKRQSQEIVSFDTPEEISSHKFPGLNISWPKKRRLNISKFRGFRKTPEEKDELEMQHHLQPSSLVEQALFPNLERLKTMEVSNCDKLENIFPSHMERAFASLETLRISDCNSVQVIFEFSSEMASAEDTTQLRKLNLLRLSKLKQIWSKDPQANLCFHNLQLVCVEDCENLEYLLPFSIALHAIQLEDIIIKQAGSMKQIVPDKEGTMNSPVKFELNHLTTLVLWDLHELEGFFAGNHSLSCSSLRELDVYNCAKLKLFKTRYSNNRGTVSDSKLQISMQQPLFTLEEVLCNLEKLVLNGEDANMILQGQFSEEQLGKLKILYLTKFEDEQATFPYWFLQNTTSLEHLIVKWSSFKEIFQNEMPVDEKGNFEIKMRLKKLTLAHLHELRHICKEGFHIHPVLEVLEYLKVNQCSNLKHLVPSSITFSHLRHLEVRNCNRLIDLMTSSTARSLVKLTTMKIRDCNSLEHVVAEGREEAKDEIAFSSLEILELVSLPMIRNFCSTNCVLNLPLLEKVVVKQCPRMKIFSVRDTWTPTLVRVLTNEEDEGWCWEGNLNVTVKKIFQDMALREGDEGDYEESSRNISGISGASSFEEQAGQSRGSQIVDREKQELQMLRSSFADRDKEANASSTDPQDVLSPPTFEDAGESNHSEIHPSGSSINVTSSSTIVDNKESAETQELNKVIEKPLVQSAQNTLSLATNQDAATGTQEMDETMDRPLFQATQNALNSSIAQDTEESPDSETCPSQNLFSQTTSYVIADTNETIGTREMHEAIDRPLTQTDQDTVSLATAQNTVTETQGMYENNERPLAEAAQNALNPAIAQDTELHDPETRPCENLFKQTTSSVITNMRERMHETIDRVLIQTAQNVAQDTGIDAPKMCEITETSFDQASQNTLSLTKVDAVIETQQIHETTEGDLVQAAQNILSFDIVQDAAIDLSPSQALEDMTSSIQDEVKWNVLDEAQDTGIHPSENLFIESTTSITDDDKEKLELQSLDIQLNMFNQTTTSMTADYKETIGTQEMHETNMRLLVHDAQNVRSPIEVDDTEMSRDQEMFRDENLPSLTTNFETAENRATICPAPSQASEAKPLSPLVANAYLPYLEAGVKRHTQVLDWLNTQQQGVFASLFAEVTRILRTTRRADLTDNERNHIRKCCTALEAVGFDVSWLNYVYGCIEKCGDGEVIQRKLEEAEGTVSTLKAQFVEAQGTVASLKVKLEEAEFKASNLKEDLASAEASLMLLHDEAIRLDNFIES